MPQIQSRLNVKYHDSSLYYMTIAYLAIVILVRDYGPSLKVSVLFSRTVGLANI